MKPDKNKRTLSRILYINSHSELFIEFTDKRNVNKYELYEHYTFNIQNIIIDGVVIKKTRTGVLLIQWKIQN